MRHAQALILEKLPLQPSGNLLGRPVLHQFTRNDLPERGVSGQQARLGPQGRFPGLLIGFIWAGVRAPPPGGPTSRLMGETRGGWPWTIPKREEPQAIPREMSSRSARVSELDER